MAELTRKIITFPNSYYRDEVIDGFFVPSMIKRVWAAGIQLLSDIDYVCQKNNITYYADWGTLLGAVRHGNYIPWDDDIDICMKRKDYDKFLSIVESELPGYMVVNYKDIDKSEQMFSRVVNSDHFRFDSEFMLFNSGLPFAIGVDIFPLDVLTDDEEYEQERFNRVSYIQQALNDYRQNNLSQAELTKVLNIIQGFSNKKINKNKNIIHQLKILIDEYYRQADDKPAKYYTLYPMMVRFPKHKIPARFFDETTYIPFGCIKIAVPKEYDGVLTCKYSKSYVTPVRRGGAHNYPFYKAQLPFLKENYNFEWPSYTFTDEDIYHDSYCNNITFSDLLDDYIGKIIKLHDSMLSQADNLDLIADTLCTCQSLAIELGTLIEKRYYANTSTVKILEEYCEALYTLSLQLDDPSNDNKLQVVENNLSILNNLIKEHKDSYLRELSDKKVVVFLPISYKSFEYMKPLYEQYKENHTIVKIVPVPHYEFSLDLSQSSLVCDYADYLDSYEAINYSDFDLMIYPDEIICNYPYDGLNVLFAPDKVYHSRNLHKFTNCLVYIPFFDLEIFDDNFTAKNLTDYMQSPMIALADKILLSSIGLKEKYVEILCNLTGEEKKELWEKRIDILDHVMETMHEDYNN